MITRSRLKQAGTFQVPLNQNFETTSNVAANSELFARKQIKAKVPASSENNVIDTPVKRRVLRSGTSIVSDNESESSQIFRNRKVYNDEFHKEIKRLEKQLAKLKANLEPRSQLISEQPKLVPDIGTHREPSPVNKRANPAEGRGLGAFDGSTDLDTFLVRFESCCRYFG